LGDVQLASGIERPKGLMTLPRQQQRRERALIKGPKGISECPQGSAQNEKLMIMRKS
jgi:hypothetical protein